MEYQNIAIMENMYIIPDPGVNIDIPDTSTDYNRSQKIAFILPGQQINVWRGRGVKPISSRIISDSGVT